MRKKIIIPTDFTVESLNIVKLMLNEENGENKIDIILLHGLSLTDSITDLLYYSKTRTIKSLSNPAFEEACDIIKNKFESHINSLTIDLFSGTTQNAFNNYVEALNIEKAYIPSNYQLQYVNNKSFDVLEFICNSGINISEVNWMSEHSISAEGELSNVFFNNVSRS